MTHAEITAAIEARGGYIVASFALEADGNTVGTRRAGNRPSHCGACGRQGHTVQRCTGPNSPPRLRYEERRRLPKDELADTKSILAELAEQRKARR